MKKCPVVGLFSSSFFLNSNWHFFFSFGCWCWAGKSCRSDGEVGADFDFFLSICRNAELETFCAKLHSLPIATQTWTAVGLEGACVGATPWQGSQLENA